MPKLFGTTIEVYVVFPNETKICRGISYAPRYEHIVNKYYLKNIYFLQVVFKQYVKSKNKYIYNNHKIFKHYFLSHQQLKNERAHISNLES